MTEPIVTYYRRIDEKKQCHIAYDDDDIGNKFAGLLSTACQRAL